MRLVASDTPKSSWLKLLGTLSVILLIILASPRSVNQPLVSPIQTQTASPDLADQLDQIKGYLAVKDTARTPLIYAQTYLLLDVNTSEVVIGRNTDQKIAIASTTKMMTALVALENLPLDRIVTISKYPPLIEGSKIGLLSGEKITVANLLRGLLIYSGNDAATALAEEYGGTPGDTTKFVEAMNKMARDHHLTQTSFADPAGLNDDDGHSTARDLAQIARLLLTKSFLAEIVRTPAATITSTDGLIAHQLKNTNRLILTDSPYYLPNAMGIKTGFTLAAGHCLVSAYQWQDRLLIGVVMNTTESTNTASAEEMYKLFRWADSSLVEQAY